jgi:hypothetical protein
MITSAVAVQVNAVRDVFQPANRRIAVSARFRDVGYRCKLLLQLKEAG